MTARLFTSWVRRGAAAEITEADPIVGAYAGPATFQPVITLARDGVPQAPLAGPDLPLVGPGAVIGLDPAVVVRTDPAPGTTGVEDNYLVLAELSRPDLPWLFTPAKPNTRNRLRPWLVLVVVNAARAALQPGTPLPRITVPSAELPDLDDCWASAHAQATVEDPATALQALDVAQGGAAVSRLLCLRRLQPDTAYLACIVPATLPGVRAGLGMPVDRTGAVAPAWTVAGNEDVVLPVYYSWTFSTGSDGDFKSLVGRLAGVRADTVAAFGTRDIDVTTPWPNALPLSFGTVTVKLDGALGTGAPAADALSGPIRDGFEMRITAALDFPANRQPASPGVDQAVAVIAPPLYGGRHAGADRVPGAAGWLRTLNLDPRRRMAAAFGTRYVQEHQEFLMARAWDQVGAVREVNRLRALAELAAEVADRLHERHVQKLPASELFWFSAPARTRIPVAAGTLHTAIAKTPLPGGATSVAFRRFVRPAGPLARRGFAGRALTLVDQGLRGSVRVPLPPSVLDGIAAQADPPTPSQLPATAAGHLVLRAWQALTALEQSVETRSDLEAARRALRAQLPPDLNLQPDPPVTVHLHALAITTPLLNVATLAAPLSEALRPSRGILRRLADRMRVPERLATANPARRVMAGPEFPAPLALALLREHPDAMLAGLGNFPADRVTLLVANAAFVEAFLAGANHEMNRELLWREYPTDQRGTPFRHFWPRPDQSVDVPPMTQWRATTPLGANGAAFGPAVEPIVVLLVRGEVLRRYPRTIVYAAPGRIVGTRLSLDTSIPWTAPQFLFRLGPATTAFAFPLTREQVHSDFAHGKAGMYFVFSEPVTGPRFNFDATARGPLVHWTDLDWSRVPQARGFARPGVDLAPPSQEAAAGSPRWNNDAADIARIAFARPFRCAFHADQLLAGV